MSKVKEEEKKFKQLSQKEEDEIETDLRTCGFDPVKTLGEGTYGKVFLAATEAKRFAKSERLHKILEENKDEEVAIKYASTGSKGYVKISNLYSIINEIYIIKKFPHPNIIPLYGNIYYNKEEGTQYPFCTENGIGFIMPKASGDFYKITDKEVFRKSFFDAFSALAHLHFYNILHCDIKPGNCLFDKQKGYLADLGSCIIMNKDNTVRINGTNYVKSFAKTTYMYAAPEVYEDEDEGKYSKEADIWSMGLMMYELYAGNQRFFKDENEHRKYYSSIREYTVRLRNGRKILNLTKLEELDLFDLLDKILVLDPSKRLTAEEILRHPFFHGLIREYGSHTKQEIRKVYENSEKDILKLINLVSKWYIVFSDISEGNLWIFDTIDYLYRLQYNLNLSSISEKDLNYIALAACSLVLSFYSSHMDKPRYQPRNPKFFDHLFTLFNLDHCTPRFNHLIYTAENEREKDYFFHNYYMNPLNYLKHLDEKMPIYIPTDYKVTRRYDKILDKQKEPTKDIIMLIML